MKLILKEKSTYILRFDKGEELMTELKKFCLRQKVKAGYFFGLGSASLAELSHYDMERKKYSDLRIKQKLEIISLTGIIGSFKKDTVIHLHGLFSDKSMNVRGGHVKKLIVAATAEIILQKIAGKINRVYNPKIGLNLLLNSQT